MQCLAEHVDAPQLASSFEATINKFDKNFSAHLLDLLARLSVYSTSDCVYTWKFSVYILLMPSLKDFEHYISSM